MLSLNGQIGRWPIPLFRQRTKWVFFLES